MTAENTGRYDQEGKTPVAIPDGSVHVRFIGSPAEIDAVLAWLAAQVGPAWQKIVHRPAPSSRRRQPVDLVIGALTVAELGAVAGIRDTANDPNTPVWDMLADGGIDLDLVGVTSLGTWVLLCDNEGHIAFGPATTETGKAAEGWDWTRYGDSDGEKIEAQDWAPDDAALLDVLRAASGLRVTQEQARAATP